MLAEARGLGVDHVILGCAAGNVASANTIERRGGVLETAGRTWRYRIPLR
ncbi:hypothetical protein ABZ342_29475 [Amycolatopsis sp. NPDC005961]